MNHGVILYDQKQPESVGWSAADSFSFSVSSPPALLPPHTFTILVSYQANEHQKSLQRSRLLKNAGAAADPGPGRPLGWFLLTAEVSVSARRRAS